MKRRESRGFTLIELLVVVGILAVLMAILLPSLGRARDRAKVTKCAANLRSLGQAATTYASEWIDSIPTPFRHDTPGNSSDYLPFHTYFVYSGNTPTTIYGFGLLYNATGATYRAPNGFVINVVGAGQIKDPRVFYCPSQPDAAFSFPPGGNTSSEWLYHQGLFQNTTNVRMGYLYAPYAVSNGTRYKFPWKKLGKIPKRNFVASDLIINGNSIAHMGGVGSGGRWNLLFNDGHVDTASSTHTTTRLVKDGVDFASSSKPYQTTAMWNSPNGEFYKMTEDLTMKSGN